MSADRQEMLASAGSDEFEVAQDAKDVDESHKAMSASRNAENWAIFNNKDHPLKKIMNKLNLHRTREPTQKERREQIVEKSQQHRDSAAEDQKRANNNDATTDGDNTCSPMKRPKITLERQDHQQATPVKRTVPAPSIEPYVQGVSDVRITTNQPRFEPMAPTGDTLTTAEFLGVLDASVETPGSTPPKSLSRLIK